jgi:glycerophosphoryl diester phosphodiesterase
VAALRTLQVLGTEKIPTLQEVWSAIAGKACLNIELKGPHTADSVAQFSQQVDQYPSLLVTSFNHRELWRLKQLNPAIQIGALWCGLPLTNGQFAEELGAISVHMAHNFIDREFVDDAHRRGLMVFTYTVNTPEDVARMAHLGVDGVFTNYPKLVLDHYLQGIFRNQWLRA